MISDAIERETQPCCHSLDVTFYPRLNDQQEYGKSWLVCCHTLPLISATFDSLKLRTHYKHRYHYFAID